jgi:hypothetical protein
MLIGWFGREYSELKVAQGRKYLRLGYLAGLRNRTAPSLQYWSQEEPQPSSRTVTSTGVHIGLQSSASPSVNLVVVSGGYQRPLLFRCP